MIELLQALDVGRRTTVRMVAKREEWEPNRMEQRSPAMQALQLASEIDIPPLLDRQWFGRRFCWDKTSSPVTLWFEDQRNFGLALREPGVQMLRL